MKPTLARRTGRAALAAAAVLALAGCGADPPLGPDTAAGSARMSRQHEEARQGGGESRASIYVIGSGRSQDHDE